MAKSRPTVTKRIREKAKMEKRQRKIETARQQLTLWANVVEEWGDDNAAIAIMGLFWTFQRIAGFYS